MSIWTLLGIDPTDDVRAIKSAYARHLKNTRPDEKPEEFQQLHAAYKQATAQARTRQVRESQTLTADSHALADIDEANQPRPEAPDLEPPAEANPEQEAEQKRMRAEGEQLLARCDRVLAERKGNLRGAWDFLLESPFILDPAFNDILGTHLFYKIYEHNKNHSGRRRIIHQIEPRAMTYLNDIFGWSSRAAYLEYAVGEQACAALLPLIYEREQIAYDHEAIRGVRGAEVVKQQPKLTPGPEDLAERAKDEAADRVVQGFAAIMCVLNGLGLLGGLLMLLDPVQASKRFY